MSSSKANSEASLTCPIQCNALKKNDFVMIRGRPCRIVEISFTKDGKHGHAKAHIVAIDIFTKKKMEDITPSTQTIMVPVVVRKEYQVSQKTFFDVKARNSTFSFSESIKKTFSLFWISKLLISKTTFVFLIMISVCK